MEDQECSHIALLTSGAACPTGRKTGAKGFNGRPCAPGVIGANGSVGGIGDDGLAFGGDHEGVRPHSISCCGGLLQAYAPVPLNDGAAGRNECQCCKGNVQELGEDIATA